MSAAVWFIATAGGQEGPLDEAGLARAVAEGRLTPETFVWREGMSAWAAARDVPAVARLAVAPAGAMQPALGAEEPGAAVDPAAAARAAARARAAAEPVPVRVPAPDSARAAGEIGLGFIGLLGAAFAAGFGLMAAYVRFVLPSLQ